MSTAFKPADILLPNGKTDMFAWSVVACDQYTSEPEYWKDVERTVGDKASTLNMILPEIYLSDSDVEARIQNIHKTMDKYLSLNIFNEYRNSYIYTERIQSNGILRQGLVGMIDLEEYDYSKGSASPVRATEATVVERIPPRIKVRRGAGLELPHIMILIDDENKTVIEPIGEKIGSMEKLYDFSLMKNGGSIKGYLVQDDQKDSIDRALTALGDKNTFNEKYGLSNAPVLLYAMGDGNHSLATAKAYYEELKANNPDKDMSLHPARYALVEIVNLHSEALQFEAIHRIVTDVDCNDLLASLKASLSLTETDSGSGQAFTYVYKGVKKKVFINNKLSNLTVGSLQAVLDDYIKENGGKVDYIHGADVLEKLAQADNSIGFILPDMLKSELFPTVIKDGALPRKTFSMGHAEDKRFYIECRKIIMDN